MLPDGPQKNLARDVAALLHKEQQLDAAKQVADFCGIKINLKDAAPDKYIPILQHYLHWCLNNNATEEAAAMLWTENQFTSKPQYTKDLWRLFDEASLGLIMGAASCSKSHTMGVRLFLEFIRDPEWTSIKVIGPSQDHLEANLFSSLVGLHQKATLPMPGTVGELFIGLDRRDQLGSIKGLVIPVGKVKKAGRLQGGKRKPRPNIHPIFGALSRLFIFVDELENVAGGLWSDIDNVLAMVEEEGGQNFKIFGAYNPSNQTDECGKRAEPSFGWENLDAEKHFRWRSRRGWEVLRLSGEMCENVVQNKTIYPGLQTRAGLAAIAKNAGGLDSAGYSTMAKGLYPRQGISVAIVPPGLLAKMRGEFIWLDEPQPVGAADLALEGGAATVFTLGRFGKASGMKLPADLDNPRGKTVMFRDQQGQVRPRFALQIDSQHALPKGDSIAMSNRLIELCKKAGVKSSFFAVDRTGHGAGTADLIKHTMGEIQAVNYSESASIEKLMVEDSQTCVEQFDRMNSELWYALRCWAEYGYLLLAPSLDMTDLTQQLTQRRMKTAGKKSHVESKHDYISRGFVSPDAADSLTLAVHAARKGSGLILSRLGDSVSGDGDDDSAWWAGEGSQRISICNKQDHLDA